MDGDSIVSNDAGWRWRCQGAPGSVIVGDMKQMFLIGLVLLALGGLPARAQTGPDDQYVMIYSMIQQGDTLAISGQPVQAITVYEEARQDLEKFGSQYPEWSPQVVSFRLKYLADRIAATLAQVPAGTAAAPSAPPTVPPAAPAAGAETQLNELRALVQSLQSDNTTLNAKLKEALAIQPAPADAGDLAAAQEQVRTLMKENDLLRITLAGHPAPAAPPGWLVTSNALLKARQSLADKEKKLEAQLAAAVARADQAEKENQALQARLKSVPAGDPTESALREENARLKKQAATATAAAAAKKPADDSLAAQLAAARAQVAALQTAALQAAAEKAALLRQIEDLESAALARAGRPDTNAP